MNEALVISGDTPVTCPKCEHEFSLEQGFARQALERLSSSSRESLAAIREQERVGVRRQAEQLAAERVQAAQRQIEEMFTPQLEALKHQLQDSQGKLQVLRADQLALRDERQKLKDEKDALALEVRKQVDDKLREREDLVRAHEQERAALDKAELQKKLDDAYGQLNDAQRKLSQGSQQLQGEVLELALEEQLRQAFPVDAFEEVRKGARGADVMQRVTTRTLQVAGTILWEAKRAKEWVREWPAKLKQDMRAAGADVGILVTTTLPAALPAAHVFGLHEDVWVSSWGAAIPLAVALRERVLEVHKQRAISAGKGEKMEALYDYLTSPQFAQKLKAVYATFQSMQEDLQKERNAAEQRLARREKQIATGMKELLGFAGDVQGLSQQALPQLEMESAPAEIPQRSPEPL